MEQVRVHFLGAAGTVTGSKFLLETSQANILIDCGAFQGLKELRLMNWQPLSFPATDIDVVLLTHGHLDHVGYLPNIIKQGFHGEIIGTPPTLRISEIILRDSAKIQEEEAEQANKQGYSKHHPAEPLYDSDDAEKVFHHFRPQDKDVWFDVSTDIRARFRFNGHIIGATFIELDVFGKRFVFSGDIGRQEDVLLNAPDRPEFADYIFLESTYGDKDHPKEDVEETLIQLIHDTLDKKGLLIIPSFAVERTQGLMFILWQLYKKGKIPKILTVLDSPMGNRVLEVFQDFSSWHKLSVEECIAMCNHFQIVESFRETWTIIDDIRPKIVLAGSGMITGGRVLTYLKYALDKPSTNILLVGYMAEGTRGRSLLEGAGELKIQGKFYPVKARVHMLESLSAHADQSELLYWLQDIKNIPEKIFLIHGEKEAAETLQKKITETYNWSVHTPALNEITDIWI